MKLAFAISLALLVFPQTAEPTIPVQSPISRLSEPLDQPIVFRSPPLPPDIGESGNRFGQSCSCTDMSAKGKELAALVPNYGAEESGLVWGLTTEAHPTFWFYVPYSRRFPANLALLDETDHILSETQVSLTGRPGIIGVPLPSTARPLEIGKRYHWFFDIHYQQGQPPAYVDGWIRRDKLNAFLKSQLWKATPKQRVSLLAPNGFWYDALTASAEIRRTEPKNTAWAELLQAVGLEAIAQKPILNTP